MFHQRNIIHTIPLQIGDRSPNFELLDQDATAVSLYDFRGQIVVLFFYPLDYSPLCTLEVIAFRNEYDRFARLGAEVLGVSSNSPETHANFCTKLKLPFRLLSDPKNSVRNAFGAINGLGFSAGRVTYVIDQKAIVRWIYVAEFSANKHSKQAFQTVVGLTECEQMLSG